MIIPGDEMTIKFSLEKVIKVVALIFALFHIYTGTMGPFQGLIQRSIHVGGGFVIFFLMSMEEKHKSRKGMKSYLPDILLLLVSVFAAVYVVNNFYEIVDPFFEPSRFEIILALLFTFVVLEVTRRMIGIIIPGLACLMIIYALFGKYFPGVWHHNGVSLEYLVEVLFFSDRGIWGLVTGISATVIASFIIFGSVLFSTGGGKTFIDLSCYLVGNSYGGAAKIATVASSLFGMISGSGSANVATTGAFTIPLMKRVGYAPEFAGAVEAAASEGGQIMPPILGAACFIMAEILGESYARIALSALLPAILYYFGVFFSIDLEARKRKYRGVPTSEIPPLKSILYYKNSLPVFLPVLTLIAFFLLGYTPVSCAMRAIFVAVVFYLAFDIKNTKRKVLLLLDALARSSKDMLPVIGLIACAQIILSLIAVTGIGVKLTNVIIEIGKNNMTLAGVLAMVGTTILGMGLPTTAAYLLGAAIMSPALIHLGAQPLAAHFFIFYYACFSGMTPPVCPTVYIGATIAGSNWLKTAWIAMRLAVGGYLVPFIFLQSPALLLIGKWYEIVQAAATSIAGIVALSICSMGYIRFSISPLSRFFFCISGILLLHPGTKTDLLGCVLLAINLFGNVYKSKKGGLNMAERRK